MKIIECVPNFSEGKEKAVIARLEEAVCAVAGVKLLDTCVDPDHNRTVLTFIGDPDSVVAGAEAAGAAAIELIDMCAHTGAHPRIGAADVVPFVPLRGARMADAVEAAHRFGRSFGERYGTPVYFYGEAALVPERRELPFIRRGGYERLKERIYLPEWEPDAGPHTFNPRCGAVAVGAREPLIAFNVNLASDNLEVAKKTAGRIREANGGLPCVRAIGVRLRTRGIVQVSINLINYKITPLRTVFQAVRNCAAEDGVEILESELVGLAPEGALSEADAAELLIANFTPDKIIERHLA
ncbi:MAG: glutamate formimidoyltransferase [Syntrophales bacterium]|nr:glutamate formimidoyltransferase [Syntrophales bacterium]MDD5533386.1 glutamate formimidoyltransferase [Syntrophales bacterium]